MNNKISHPKHYTQGSIECWDYITSHKMGYLEGNIVKYVTRYKYKDGLDDLFKAKAYLERLIEAQFGPAIVEEPDLSATCGCGLDGRNCPPGGHSPCAAALKDVERINGAIPLQESPPNEGCTADISRFLTYPGAPPAQPPLDEYCLGDFRRYGAWLQKPWINE